jgi:pilS domain protein
MIQKNKKNEQGFSLIEVIGAIAIASVIFALAAIAISDGRNSARVSSAQESLSYLRMNIHSAYSHVHSFASISNEELIAAKAVPQTMLINDSITNAWNGDVTVASANGGRAFTIQYDDVPEDACIKFGSQRDMWDALSINGTDIERETVVTTEHCTDELSNTIIFTAH